MRLSVETKNITGAESHQRISVPLLDSPIILGVDIEMGVSTSSASIFFKASGLAKLYQVIVIKKGYIF